MKRTVWVVLIVSLFLNGCGAKNRRAEVPPKNEAIESKIQSKLKGDPLTAAWQIRPKLEGDTVTLTGLVDREEERQRAEELTKSVVGELRRVDNQLMLTQEVILDNSIVAALKTELVTDPATRQANIDVQSRRGVVVLEGEVQTKDQRRQAEALAKEIAGVKQVENNLKVQG
ncbi:MAG: BON domain-containing protein [Candidatus Manganitrophus sp.]|nr:BON domain-containing protein [Candidatus Manganitrophus morganii]WDT75105.1 MAG: BON domain-containing protein [Candidatus Manganitrophus sp.]